MVTYTVLGLIHEVFTNLTCGSYSKSWWFR